MNRTGLVHITTVPETLMFLRGQTRHMLSLGFQVCAVSSPGPMLGEFASTEGIAAREVRIARKISPFLDLHGVGRLVYHLNQLSPLVVHAHTPKAGLLGMIAARIVGVPLCIYHIHGLPLMTANGWKRHLLHYTERLSCSLAHRVLCVSESIRDVAVQLKLCPPEKIKVIRNGTINGIDATTRFNPRGLPAGTRDRFRARLGIPDAARVIGFVGRIVRDKGLVELVSAWNRLRCEYPDLRLVVVGPFEARDPIPDDVRQVLQSDPRIHLTGQEWDTAPLYSIMDLLVLPTYREGFPYVPMEAAAMMLPVVATRIPGCIDAVVDGATGTLVPVRDSNALASAIRVYLDNPGLRLAHGRAGRERVLQDFQPRHVWEGTYQEYSTLLAKLSIAVPVRADDHVKPLRGAA